MKKQKYPILEYDNSKTALINPDSFYKKGELPQYCVICFFKDVLTKLRRTGEAKYTGYLSSEMGKQPILKMVKNGKSFVVFQSAVGAPLAAGFLEELIAKGCKNIIACGGAGARAKK